MTQPSDPRSPHHRTAPPAATATAVDPTRHRGVSRRLLLAATAVSALGGGAVAAGAVTVLDGDAETSRAVVSRQGSSVSATGTVRTASAPIPSATSP